MKIKYTIKNISVNKLYDLLELYNLLRALKLLICITLSYIILKLIYNNYVNLKKLSHIDVMYSALKPYKVEIAAIIIMLIIYRGRKIYNLLKKIFTAKYCSFVDEIFIISVASITMLIISIGKIINFVVGLSFLIFIVVAVRIKCKKEKTNSRSLKIVSRFPYLDDRYAENIENDLLSRKNFVYNLKDAVISIKDKSSFTIGLNGQWGEGKTTILSFLYNELNKEDNIIIVKFNPWFYNTKEDIIRNFYNCIVRQLKSKLIISGLTQTLYKYRNVVSQSLKAHKLFNITDILIPIRNCSNDIDELTKKISRELTYLNKKVVVIIDDLDRIDKEDLLLVFKLIKICCDIDNFIYILSFDKEQIKNVFGDELKIDGKYLDKIIQVSIDIPKADAKDINLYLKDSILYLFQIYEYDTNDESNKSKYILKSNIYNISKAFSNLREVKRYINELNFYFSEIKEKLNLYDGFILKTMKFVFPLKYKELSNKKDWIIYELSKKDGKYIRDAKIEKDIEQFFKKDLTKEESFLIEYLYNSFIIRRHKKNYNRLRERNAGDPLFFDSYFTLSRNDYIEKDKILKNYFKKICNRELEKLNLPNVFGNEDDITIESINLYLKEYCSDNIKIVLSIIEQLYKKFFQETGIKKVTIARLIIEQIQLNYDSYENKIKEFFSKSIMRKDIIFIYYLYTKCDYEFEQAQSLVKQILEIELDEKYLNANNNMFDEKNYNKIFYIFLIVESESKVKKYLKEIIDYNNIFKIIECFHMDDGEKCIRLSDGYSYIIDSINEYIEKSELLKNNSQISNEQNIKISHWITYNQSYVITY